MSDIFLCYSRTDATIANQLVERLQTEGWSVFIDRNTPVGTRWHRKIEARRVQYPKGIAPLTMVCVNKGAMRYAY